MAHTKVFFLGWNIFTRPGRIGSLWFRWNIGNDLHPRPFAEMVRGKKGLHVLYDFDWFCMTYYVYSCYVLLHIYILYKNIYAHKFMLIYVYMCFCLYIFFLFMVVLVSILDMFIYVCLDTSRFIYVCVSLISQRWYVATYAKSDTY